ncbi:unnamed protein product (macronuclear) [Paramecium tetraurelia]|uniref:Transmembrane protein n=1 Tax=Paramecium tetraurelia TaxID=5888 RepID=A0DEV5_PARTE|nr:uncharacterized protein GSPATT00016398001 [Paramecium tetraurelia]CAK81572.1 unnamed protein product [Paramecium tetraurelia]|eukprot:XP_001448969.1 hypothetical protein (macronuclear) [Paramecium tetraurelia strain d4-2]
MLLFLIYITQSLSYLIFEQNGRINNSLHIDLNITKEQKQLLDKDYLWFDFQFDFPTPISIELENTITKLDQLLQVQVDDAQYGLFICKDFQLSNQKTTMILDPLPQYQEQWYKYKVNVNKYPRILTRFQPELGFTKNSSEVIYSLNMTYETSGFYQIEINYKYGSGNLELQTCKSNVCNNQNNETKLLLNFSQIECTLILKDYYQDLCSHQLKVTTTNATFYYLTFKHYSSANVQFIKPNKISQIEIVNKEASLVLDDLNSLNFIYTNQKIKAIQYSEKSRNQFESNVIILAKEEQNLQDWDQNFYLQSNAHQNLTLQYLNSIQTLYLNSNFRLEQEEDSYAFYCVDTIFSEFVFELFVYDYELLVQIYFSNNTLYPNEHQNEFELIESNIKSIKMNGDTKMYIGIKTKQKALEYQLHIREPTFYFLNLFQLRRFSYCKTCQMEYKYASQSNAEIQLHIYYDQMNYEQDNSLFEIQFIENGKFIKPIQTYHSQNYLRFSLQTQVELQYIILTKSKIQQDLEIMITDTKLLELQFNQDISSIDFAVEIFKIQQTNNNIFYFYFKEDIEEKILIINRNGQSEVEKIAQNYYKVQFINNVREDAYTYFMIEGIKSQITFQVQEKTYKNIELISKNIFLSPLKYEQQLTSLTLNTQILNCTQLKCDELHIQKILIITKIGFKNKSIEYSQGYYNLSEYHQTLNELYDPISNIQSIQLFAQINENNNNFNFSSQNQIMLQRQEPQLQNLLFAILYIIFIVFLGYIVFKMIFRKKVSIFPKNINKRRHNYEDEEESISIDDI